MDYPDDFVPHLKSEKILQEINRNFTAARDLKGLQYMIEVKVGSSPKGDSMVGIQDWRRIKGWEKAGARFLAQIQPAGQPR